MSCTSDNKCENAEAEGHRYNVFVNAWQKQLLFNRIHNSSGVTKVSDDEFEYYHALVVEAKVPTWVILAPEVIPPVDGINMGTGA